MPNIKTLIRNIENNPYNDNIKFSELDKYLEHYGIIKERVNGSHNIYKNNKGNCLVVPCHDGKVKAVYVKKAYDLVKDMEGKQ